MSDSKKTKAAIERLKQAIRTDPSYRQNMQELVHVWYSEVSTLDATIHQQLEMLMAVAVGLAVATAATQSPPIPALRAIDLAESLMKSILNQHRKDPRYRQL